MFLSEKNNNLKMVKKNQIRTDIEFVCKYSRFCIIRFIGLHEHVILVIVHKRNTYINYIQNLYKRQFAAFLHILYLQLSYI